MKKLNVVYILTWIIFIVLAQSGMYGRSLQIDELAFITDLPEYIAQIILGLYAIIWMGLTYIVFVKNVKLSIFGGITYILTTFILLFTVVVIAAFIGYAP